MKKIILPIFAGLLIVCTAFTARAQTSPVTVPAPGISNPWTNSQLLEPSELAADIKAGETKTPIIFNIGAVEDIKGAIHIGAVNNAENLEKLKELKLEIDDYSNDTALRSSIRAYNDLLTAYTDRMGLPFYLHSHLTTEPA